MARIRWFFMFFCVVLLSFSQKKELNEALFFEDYKKDTIHFDLLKGMSIIDAAFTAQKFIANKKNLDSFIEQLPEKAKSDKKEKKRIKKIYDLIHKMYFKKYEEKAFFHNIFENGNYNCVTATALYVYVFDAIDVPYQIMELPSHVYLIAYPLKYKIHLETTVPGAYGFFVPSEKDIKKLVDELVAVKLITQEELQNKGYDTMYKEYYYGDDSSDKNDLLGMQYHNKAIFNFEKKQYGEALKNIEKALIFYDNPSSKIVITSIIYSTMRDGKYANRKDIIDLFNAIQLLEYKKDIDKATVKSIIASIVTDDNNDLKFIESLVVDFENIKNEDLKKDSLVILYRYLYEKHYNEANYTDAIKYLKILIENKPQNKLYKEQLVFSVFNEMFISEINEANVLKLENYIIDFPYFLDKKRIVTVSASFYAQIIEKKYRLKEEKKMMLYFNKFEELISKKKEIIQVPPSSIASIYLHVGRFYYGRQRNKEAKAIFEKGLVQYPENLELKKMLKWCLEDLGIAK